MKINWKTIVIFIIAGLIVYTSNDVTAGENGNDVVLVMDSSGSMKKTDPMSLRIPAAKLFISLLNKNDRASVVSFSDTSYPIIHLTPVDSETNKEQLLKAAEKISSAGLFTNLYDALAAGLDILSNDEKKERSKIIVLMSDGMMDVGNTDKDKELVDKIRNELTATLEDKGIKVYTIAFTEQSDRLLLEKISKRTGGFYNLALSDKDFHLVFTSIFESLKSPDMLPMSENGFLIDGSIEEVTIVATKGSPKTQIRLNSPDGRSYSNKEKSTGIGWFVSDNFDMITIKTPAGGRWEILFSTGENNKAYIITNLKLQSNFDQLYSTFGDPLDIKIWLEKDGITIKEQDVLDKFDIYIELTGPDGNATKLQPFNKGDGIFERNIAPFTSGNYKLRIVAQGNTFEREKAYVFNIADAKESKEDMLLKREKEKKVQEQARHIPAEDNMTNDIAWKKVIIQFVSINLAIGIIVLVYVKRKSLGGITAIKNILRPARIKNLSARDKTGRQVEQKELKKEQQTQGANQIQPQEVKTDVEVKPGFSEQQELTTVPEAKEVQPGPEVYNAIVAQKEDETQIKEIPLDEEENNTGVQPGEEKPQDIRETHVGEQKQENLRHDIDEGSENINNDQWHDVDNSKHILNQDDLNQLLGAGTTEGTAKDKDEHIADLELDDGKEGNIDLQNKEEGNYKKDNGIQNEVLEDIDQLWKEALQSQKEADAGEVTNGQEEQINALDMEIERLEKARSEEVSRPADAEGTSIESTGRDETESGDASTELTIEDKKMDNTQEDIDAMWQEAMMQQKADDGGRKINEESMPDD